MADARFFRVQGPFTVGQIAAIAKAELADPGLAERAIKDVAPLEVAGGEHLSFLDNKLYVDAFARTQAGACIVAAEHKDRAPAGVALLFSQYPYRSYALAAQAFYPPVKAVAFTHPSAIVDPSAQVAEGCVIEAGVVIAARVVLGRGCHIGPNAVLGEAIELGESCTVGACASLSHCIVGARVTIFPGARIGQAGFGFAVSAEGVTNVPQLGRVVIEDDVEIGANTTIDRGAGPDTVIGRGTMIDNLVQIGHNVRIGKGCILAGQVGVSGSTRIEDYAMLGGQAGLVGHLTIGKGARIGAQAGIFRDIPAGETVAGCPGVPIRQHFREVVVVQRLAKGKGK
ncbi:MAG: UDP-3-O-(3-hydroxymyristoyl)glucosamine N-acyltransferase [Alphaproteobacteria bacterium]|nr:UDP-3-O-(3-hydroxymyristoyl)glucosamine N-acyltransferase [Alphaproteobacteria bacterium]